MNEAEMKYMGPQPETTVDPGSIPSLMDICEQAAISLEKSISLLRDKLNPIMMDDMAANPVDSYRMPDTRSHLGVKAVSIYERITQADRYINDITSRVNL